MRLVVAVAIALCPATVSANPASNDDGWTLARQAIPATGPSSVVAASKVIYLNRTGVTLQPGANDARTNKSTLATRPVTIPPWNTTTTIWNQTVDCMKELFAPFDVVVVQTDPGPTVQHIEAVFGGQPGLLNMDLSVAGVAPFLSDCTIIENAMVFTFADHIEQDPRVACEIMAQEVAHAYGLDHEMLPNDPMTYLRYEGKRSFQNQLAECGEDTARKCGIDGSSCRGKQNTVQLLFERLGAKAMPGDFTPPTVAITSPAEGATVAPGFEVIVSASDNTRVTMASMYIDNVPSGSASVAPWTIKTPETILKGRRTIKIEVTDGRNTRSTEIHVTVEDEGNATDLGGACQSSRQTTLFVAFALLMLMRAGTRRFARSR